MPFKIKSRIIFLIGSRTGGPLIPLLGIKDQLLDIDNDLHFKIIGVKGGFEEEASRLENIPLLYLPEVKRRKPTASNGTTIMSRLWNIFYFPFIIILDLIRFFYSLLKSTFYLIRFHPVLVLSMSNFLSVPVIWSGIFVNLIFRLLNLFQKITRQERLHEIKMVLHQLDMENLTVKLCAKFVHVLSVGFPALQKELKHNSILLPNPVRYNRFDALTPVLARRNLIQHELLPPGKIKNPILLIFGGGSGSEFINQWVLENLEKLTAHFQIIHLTGFLQNKRFHFSATVSYTCKTGLNLLMPDALKAADVVISRAGMSAISELLYLKKKAYLVPIPQSHQEYNASAVCANFTILLQKDVSNWLKRIINDKKRNFAAFNKIKWDYYNRNNKYAFRDLLFTLIQNPVKTIRK